MHDLGGNRGARGGALASAFMTTMTWPAAGARPVGELLREWRERRRISQLDLAIRAEVSARHLSFVETGRSRPTPAMILRLTEQLEVPLRERNTLLLAGGYAPAYPEHGLDEPELRHRAQALGDPRLLDLRDELLSYPGGMAEVTSPAGVVLPLRYRHAGQELSLFSISAVVGTATDVTVAELAIEAFYPADAATAAVLHSAR